MRENKQKEAAQNDENQILPQLAAVKQQPSSSLSFVGISKRNRFWGKFWYLIGSLQPGRWFNSYVKNIKMKKAIMPEINN